MQTIRDRATESLPGALLTLLGIIQALALELLWSNAREAPHLRSLDLAGIAGWLQVAGVFLGVVVVWLLYMGLVMRLRWLPSTRDSVLPFVIGLGEFLLATWLEPALLHRWLYVMAAVYLLSAWTGNRSFLAARQSPENREFFEGLEDPFGSGWSVPLVVASLLVALGAAVQGLGPGGWLGLAATATTVGALVFQIVLLDRWWTATMRPDRVESLRSPSSGGP